MFGVDSVTAISQRKCAEELLALEYSHRRAVMVQLCFDRINQKQEFLVDKFHDTDNWNETAYYMLLRSLDIRANRASYERLAKILPYHYLYKTTFNRSTIEAMLLGCSGLLPRLVGVCNGNREILELQDIFTYNSHKLNLESMRADEWQIVGQRGDNHPVIRLLQLASLLSQHVYLLNDLLDCRNRRDVERFFCNTDVPRWAYRFLSDEESNGAFSRTKAQMLGINVVAQMQIFYSEYTLRSDLDSRGIDLLEQLPAERNQYIDRWSKLGIKPENALESQALLQLTKEYCSSLLCDKCPFRRFVDAK
jgi:hypothetical protein